MRVERFRRACVVLVSASLVSLGMQTPAAAGIVGTAEAVSAARAADPLAAVQGVLARDDVRGRLVALGVDPAEVNGRLAALTDAEIAALAQEFDRLPAGGDALAVLGIVFLVLLVLELTGTIDIFKKT